MGGRMTSVGSKKSYPRTVDPVANLYSNRSTNETRRCEYGSIIGGSSWVTLYTGVDRPITRIPFSRTTPVSTRHSRRTDHTCPLSPRPCLV